MRLIIVLLTTGIMQVSASSFAQNLTYSKQGASLHEIFVQIRKQTNYLIIYSDKKIDDTQKLDVNFNNTPIKEVLDLISEQQSFLYLIDEKTISIKPKESTFLERLADRWAAIDVRGRVVDQEGKPLSGATVKIKSSGKSVSTNTKGEFYLEKVDEGAVLVISFIGYVSKEVEAVKEMGSVVLELSDAKLDEVQVIAYGETSRRLSTGNVNTVKAKEIENMAISNPLLALSGRVPGVFIQQSSGIAGGGVKILIQGQNSISKGNEPFYVIDGVPYTGQLLPNSSGQLLGSSGFTASANGNPLNYINPNDIESISILKDADATAIYGSRAANGAILITTKKGKAGKVRLDLNLQQGIGDVTRRLPVMNTRQYLMMRREAIANDGKTIGPTDYDLNGLWDTTRNVDWQKELIGNTAHYTNLNASMSGGTQLAQYLFSGTYKRESSVFPGNFADQKAGVHFQLSSQSSDSRFTFNFSTNYLYDDNRLPGNDLTPIAIRMSPNAPAPFNLDGTLNWMPNAAGNSTWTNPYVNLFTKYSDRTTNLIASANLGYEILEGLKIASSFGYTNLRSIDIKTLPKTIQPPERQAISFSSANYGDNTISSWIIEPQINYLKTIKKNRIEALVGTTIQQNKSNSLLQTGTDFISDQVLEDIKQATNVTIFSTVANQYKYNALFGRINYSFDSKYIVDFNMRRDGSSRFGSVNRFHNFGSIGVAWILSEETFIKNRFTWLSLLKLKGSYGTTGNDQIGDYQYLNLYVPASVGVPYQGIVSITPVGLKNPYLEWEETRKLQMGLSLGLWADRLLVDATYYHNRSSNQLLPYSLPISTGFGGITSNFPAVVENTGYEFSLNSANLRSNKLTWQSYINLTIPRNRLVSFPDLAQSTYASLLVIGKSLNITKIYRSAGVDIETGLFQIYDAKGNITSNPNPDVDRTKIIDNYPQYYGGLGNTFSYGGLSLDFLFQFVKQQGLNRNLGQNPGIFNSNEAIYVLDRWQKPGDIAPTQKFTTAQNIEALIARFNALGSNLAYADASYIRLKNIMLSWQIPNNYLQKLKVQNAKVFVQGQNVLTFTKFKGMDPENLSISNLPLLRMLTVGAQIGF